MLYRYSLKARPSVYLLYRRCTEWVVSCFGAATQIRTGDLILTKDVLYQLSHSSVPSARRLL